MTRIVPPPIIQLRQQSWKGQSLLLTPGPHWPTHTKKTFKILHVLPSKVSSCEVFGMAMVAICLWGTRVTSWTSELFPCPASSNYRYIHLQPTLLSYNCEINSCWVGIFIWLMDCISTFGGLRITVCRVRPFLKQLPSQLATSNRPFSHHYQASFDFNTVNMYFLIFTCNRDDIKCMIFHFHFPFFACLSLCQF